MKTPIQELIEWMEQNQYFIGNDLYGKYHELLEKEKEVIMRVYQDGLDNGFSNGNWKLEEYYEETFKTKERG